MLAGAARSAARCGAGAVRTAPSAAWSMTLRRGMSSHRLVAPPMVYIQGEEMTRYAMELILEEWVKPHIDISSWEFYDLSCKARDVRGRAGQIAAA